MSKCALLGEEYVSRYNRFLLNLKTKLRQIEWSVKGGSLRNIESARISVPATLKYNDEKKW